jgi:hypothetical protein
MEQGIFLTEQGIVFVEQGNLAAEQGIGPRDQFFDHMGLPPVSESARPRADRPAPIT